MEEHPQPAQPVVRTDETVAEQFPDRGPAPDNRVVVNPDAEPTPDIGHPVDNRRPEDEL